MASLSGDFAGLCPGVGQPSLAPGMLLRAMLLQAFHLIRSTRQLMKRLEFDLLFHWVVRLGFDAPVRDHSTFSKIRDRPLDRDVVPTFLAGVLAHPRVEHRLSSEHFSIYGALIKARAGRPGLCPHGRSL